MSMGHFVSFLVLQLIYDADKTLVTVKIWKTWTPEEIAAIILKFESCGFTIEKCIRKILMGWQTV